MDGMAEIINIVANRAAQLSPQSEQDFVGADGLLYCGKCHAVKQYRGVFLGVERIVPCICKCRAAELIAEEEARKQLEQAKAISAYRQAGFPESDMQNWTFANDDGENTRIMRAMKNYVKNFDSFKASGKGLLLHGGVGTGKTYAAACIVNALIDKGRPCLMTNFSRVLNTLWGMDGNKQNYIDSLNRFDLLVLDDLGAERRSEYAQEQVFNVIDGRYRAKLPLIVTTNLSIEEIKKPDSVGNSRIYDRVLEMCHPVEVTGYSRRRAKVKESYTSINDLLGL